MGNGETMGLCRLPRLSPLSARRTRWRLTGREKTGKHAPENSRGAKRNKSYVRDVDGLRRASASPPASARQRRTGA
eukprot:8962787-Pyramimonas_sp.AAC.1